MKRSIISLWLLALLHIQLPEQWHHWLHLHEHTTHHSTQKGIWFDDAHQHCLAGWDYMMPSENAQLADHAIAQSVQIKPYFLPQPRIHYRFAVLQRLRGPPLLL